MCMRNKKVDRNSPRARAPSQKPEPRTCFTILYFKRHVGSTRPRVSTPKSVPFPLSFATSTTSLLYSFADEFPLSASFPNGEFAHSASLRDRYPTVNPLLDIFHQWVYRGRDPVTDFLSRLRYNARSYYHDLMPSQCFLGPTGPRWLDDGRPLAPLPPG